MFKDGRNYRITLVQELGNVEAKPTCRILAFEAPLLHVSAPLGEMIINTSSPSFVMAELLEEGEKE